MPHMRFYAEVPITSPAGHVIDTFCVVDNKPRDGTDEKGLVVLTEISAAIMRHLELVQMQNHFNRADQMLKRLGMFVEKKSIPVQWAPSHSQMTMEGGQKRSTVVNRDKHNIELPIYNTS
ncbi:hypothetical protein DL95DRAFT_79724 [Leptodontidium sp. 2 PMI_412]|nr:hypothetical protein DL95DRAFT_79724 [Leptodontidium sp. 2 PMI_412]